MHLINWCCTIATCMFKITGWDLGGGGVQGFQLKSRDFGQPVQGSALSRLASMIVMKSPSGTNKVTATPGGTPALTTK